MRRFLLLGLVLTGCAHLQASNSDQSERTALWTDAHQAFVALDFPRAEAAFERLVNAHRESVEGRESLFYLGAIQIDPRNPDWSSEEAQDWLERYLSLSDDGGPRLYRYPEARTLLGIAQQLNLPAEARVEPLRPEERVDTIAQPIIVPADQSRQLTEEIERLRAELAERNQELERIRRTLTPSTNRAQ